MRYAIALLIALSIHAHADSFGVAPVAHVQSVAEAVTTTTSNTSEQTLVEIMGVSSPLVLNSIEMDMTNATTFTAMNFKIYRKRAGGSYVLLGTPSNLTGINTWTLATSAKGFEVLTFNVAMQSGDSFKVTGTQTILSAVFAIPYTVLAFR